VRTAFGREFDVPDGYLNTAGIGVPPVCAADAVAAGVDDWRRGAARPSDFDPAVAAGRAAFADLVGVAVDRVAIGASVSSLVGLIAAALPAGARVLVAEGEFTSVSFPFAAQAVRGVSVVECPLEALGERAPGFDLVAVSVVQSADGRTVDLDALRAARASARPWCSTSRSRWAGCRPGSTGPTPSSARATSGCSARAGWPGWRWTPPRTWIWFRTRPAGTPGATCGRASTGLPLRLADSARRFDASPAWFSHVGAAAVLPWLAGLDRAAVRAHCVGLADAVRTGLDLPPARSAIVAVDRSRCSGPARRGGCRREPARGSGAAVLPPLQHRRRRARVLDALI
jgi:hypothetical protein